MKQIIVLFLTACFFATSTYAQEIPKSDWINYVKKELPEMLCQDDQYGRQCFNVSPDTCLQVVRKASLDCLTHETPNLPKILDFITGEQWGKVIRTCVDGKYEKRFYDKKSKAPQCGNRSSWIK